MTYEEALRELRDSIKGAGYQCHIETYEKAIEALEKQIPRKIKRRYYQDFDESYSEHCPNCGNQISRRYVDRNLPSQYCCERCGQTIDWSEKE